MTNGDRGACLVCEAPLTRPDVCTRCGISFAHPSYRAIEQADAAIRQCDDRWRELWAVREQWVEHRKVSLAQARAATGVPVQGTADAGVEQAPPLAPSSASESAGAASAHAPGFSREAAPEAAAQSAPPRRTPSAPANVPAAAATRARPVAAPAPRPSRLTAPVLLGVGGAALLIASAIVFIAVTWTTLEPALQALMVGGLSAGVVALAVWLDRRDLSVSAGAVGVVSMAFAGVAVVALDRDFAALGAWGGAVVLATASAVGSALHRLRVDWVGMAAALAAALAGLWAAVGAAVELGSIGGSAWLTFVVAAALAAAAVAGVSQWWSPASGATVLRWSAVALAAGAGLATPVATLDEPGGVSVLLAGAAPVAVLSLLALRWDRLALAPIPVLVPMWAGAVAFAMADGDPDAAFLAGSASWAAVMVVTTRASARRQRVVLAASAPAAIWFALVALSTVGVAIGWALSTASSAQERLWSAIWLGQPDLMVAGGLAVAAAATTVVRRWAVASAWSTVAQVAGASLAIAAAASTPSAVLDRATWLALALVASGGVLAAACRAWGAGAARWTAGLGGLALAFLAGVLAAWEGATGQRWALAVGTLAVGAIATGVRWRPRMASASALLLATLVAGAAGWAVAGTATGVIGVSAAIAVAALAALRWARPAWSIAAAVGAIPALVTAALVVLSSVVSSAVALLTGGTDGGASWWTFLAAGLVAGGAVLARGLRGAGRRDGGFLDAVAAGAVAAVPPLVLGAMITTLPGSTSGREAAAQALSAAAAVVTVVVARLRPPSMITRLTQGAAMTWLSVLTVVAAGRLVGGESPLNPGVALLAALVVVQVALAMRWPRLAAASAALAWTVVAVAVPAASGWSELEAVALGALAAALVAWLATRVGAAVRTRVLVGAAPVAALAALVFVAVALAAAAAAYDAAVAVDVPRALPEWSHAVLAAAVFAAAASFAWVRRHALAELAGAAAFVAALSLPMPVTWIAPAAGGTVLVVVGMRQVRRLRGVGLAVMLAAIPWAAPDSWSAGLTALMAASALTWVAATTARRWPVAELAAGVVLGAVGAGLLLAPTGSVEIALIGALVVGCAAALAPWLARRDPSFTVRAFLLAALTVVCAAWSPSPWGAGLLLLLAAAAWWGLRMQGWRPAWWVCAVAASAGIAMLLLSAHITAIELYVAAPGAIALVVGVRALQRHERMPSVRALAPGLALLLVPSLIALALDPASLARTLGLTAAVLVLAAAGAALRWLAPIGAAAITAVALALTQAGASEAVLSRWIAFALVGGVLIALAATYEKIRGMR